MTLPLSKEQIEGVQQSLARLRHQPGGPTKEQREYIALVIERLQTELTATRKALEEVSADACDEEIVAAIIEEPMATRTPSRIVHYLKKHGLKIIRALPSPQVKP